MSKFYIEYVTADREDNGRGGFLFDTKKSERVGPISPDEVEKRAVDLMGDANTVPHSVKVFEEEIKSAAELVEAISEVLLTEADGDFLQRIANEVLTQESTYIGDSMFTQMVEVPGLSDLENLKMLGN
jgi:hypothetical protein